jgi:hypothetical protein
MNQSQLHTLTMLEDALATATHNPPATPPSDFSVLLSGLSTAITQAMAAAVTQTADRGSSRTAMRAARTTLFTEFLTPINTIAVGRLTTVPNVRQLFRLPARAVHRATLVKEATIIANNAAQYKDVFIASGLSADFLDRLHTAIDAVAQASDARATTRGDQQKATQTLVAVLKQGQQMVHGLNGVMQVAFAKNPEVLAAWNSARHIRRATSTPGPVALPARTSPTTLAAASAATANASPGVASLSVSIGGATPAVTAVAPVAEAAPTLHAA